MFFGRGIRVGKIFGIELRLDWSWFLIVVLFAWSLQTVFVAAAPDNPAFLSWFFGIITALLLFVSVIIHELAHSLVGKKLFGMNFKRITLFIFGGAAQFGDENSKGSPIPSAKAEFWMTFAGPLSSFALAGIFWGLWTALNGVIGPLWLLVLNCLFLINLFLGIFNLLPGFPMDGGRILRSLVWAKMNNLVRATKVTYWVGLITGVGLCLFAFLTNLVSPFWAGLIVFFFLVPAAGAEYLSVVPNSDRMSGTVKTISELSLMITLFFVIGGIFFPALFRA